MTTRQRFLKLTYPFLRRIGGLAGHGFSFANERTTGKSLHHLSIRLADETVFNLQEAKGKKILLVNTASDCGYTSQLAALEKFSQKFGDKVLLIGFPSNDFKEQERGTNASIVDFCRNHFGVQFMLAEKAVVIKSPQQQPVYKWLTDQTQNGWNNKAPIWNFCKYVINEEGKLTHYFGPAVHPNHNKLLKALGLSPATADISHDN